MISFPTAVLRLTLALVLGALVGLERERGERGAGIRTHALVALGSCLMMIVSTFGFTDILGTPAVGLDPSRIAAQVVSGIGFLGAGAILLRREIIQGLNTAASIWVVAAIGLACGGNLLPEAGVVTLLTVGIQIALRPVHMHFHRATTLHVLRLEARLAEETLLPLLAEIFQRTSVTLEQINIQSMHECAKITIECRASDIAHLTTAVRLMREIPEVQTVQLTLSLKEFTRIVAPSS